MTPTTPEPADWTWLDTFERTFLGPDYTVEVGDGNPRIENGLLYLFKEVEGLQQQAADFTRLALSPTRWNSGNIQLQYDAQLKASQGGFSGGRIGFSLTGATKTLKWAGGALQWGAATLASNPAAQIPSDGAFHRVQLTVDQSYQRIQLSVDGVGYVDVALPDDWHAETDGGATLRIFGTPAYGGGVTVFCTAVLDNLAIRSGDGTASMATGSSNSSGGVRLGGEWRFGGVPDNAIGADGDIWAINSTGELYQRVNGVYTLQMTLLAPPGPKGDTGPQGEQGIQGPQGIQGDVGPKGEATPVVVDVIGSPFLFPVTPASGWYFRVTEQLGGLNGYTLVGLSGPEASVTIDGQPAVFPVVLQAEQVVTLSRSDTSSEMTILMATAPGRTGGSGNPAGGGVLTVTTDPDGYLTSDDSRISTEPDGYLSAPDELIQADNDGYLSEVQP